MIYAASSGDFIEWTFFLYLRAIISEIDKLSSGLDDSS